MSSLLAKLYPQFADMPVQKFGFDNHSGEYQKYTNRSKSGTRPSQRLAVIIKVSDRTLSDIARIYAKNLPQHYRKKSVNVVVVKTNLSHVLAGRDSSPAYIKAIEEAWRLPMAEIRAIYNEDRQRETPLTSNELHQFFLEYKARYSGVTLAEYLDKRNQILQGGI